MIKVFIDDVEYAEKTYCRDTPENKVGATHWAELPNGEILYYIISSEVLLWMYTHKEWMRPGTVPYTLYCFDDYI